MAASYPADELNGAINGAAKSKVTGYGEALVYLGLSGIILVAFLIDFFFAISLAVPFFTSIPKMLKDEAKRCRFWRVVLFSLLLVAPIFVAVVMIRGDWVHADFAAIKAASYGPYFSKYLPYTHVVGVSGLFLYFTNWALTNYIPGVETTALWLTFFVTGLTLVSLGVLVWKCLFGGLLADVGRGLADLAVAYKNGLGIYWKFLKASHQRAKVKYNRGSSL